MGGISGSVELKKDVTRLSLISYLVIGLGTAIAAACANKSETYDLHCAVPLENWSPVNDGFGHVAFFGPIRINNAGAVTFWNDGPLTNTAFQQRLHEVNDFFPHPKLILDIASNAPCDRVREIRNMMNSMPICSDKYSRCSESRNWDSWKSKGQ
jgi:hypothetical protein